MARDASDLRWTCRVPAPGRKSGRSRLAPMIPDRSPLVPDRNAWWSALPGRALAAFVIIALGLVLGMQYMEPNSRVIGVLLAVVVIGVAWRLDIVSGVGVMILALPFPRGTTFGSTNFALILLLMMIFLLRVAQRQIPRPRGTAADVPIAGLVIAYIVSFYNVTDAAALGPALENTELFAATLLTYFLVVNSVNDEHALRRVHTFQMFALLAVLVTAVWELNHPGQDLIPGWISFRNTHGDEFDLRNVRVGATFYDYELLADFCGLNILFLIFRLARSRGLYARVFVGALLALTLFVMFCTVTRGPVVSLAVALAYLLWLFRRRLSIVPVTVGAAIIAAAFFGMNFLVANFTRSGDLLARVSETHMVGLVPDSRVYAWQNATERFLQHPLIGSGPFYSFKHDITVWFWPHNLYLYIANILGLFGLTFFVWMLVAFWRGTKPRVDTFAAPSYVESYLLLARLQCMFFLVDQIKIEYLRNSTYQFQIWLMFALWMAAERIQRETVRPTAATATSARVPAPLRAGHA